MSDIGSYLLSRANGARDGKDFVAARRWYRLHLLLRPSDAGAWVQLGHAMKETSRLGEALRCYERAERLLGDDDDLPLQKGHLYKMMGLMDDAVRAYCRSRELGNAFAKRELLSILEDAKVSRQIKTLILNSGVTLDNSAAGAPLASSRKDDISIEELQRHKPGSDGWWSLIEQMPRLEDAPKGYGGFIEGVFVSPTGDGVVFGWALQPREAMIWLEDSAQNVYPLEQAFRRKRRDIAEAFREIPWSDMESGFIAHIPRLGNVPSVRLKLVTTAGVCVLSERNRAERLLPDPRHAAESLFAIETEEHLFHERAVKVDWPLLAPLIRAHHEEIAKLEPLVTAFGETPAAPHVSVVVPLYRRFDFMEHQLLEFARDTEFLSACELIYVVDDPQIRDAVLAESISLHHLYGVPFKVVDGRRNRGFSGANNIGAAQSRGEYLLFLNSDVIPIEPGWLGKMLARFDDEATGAVGAQLLFPYGGLQHAGMEFRRFEQWNIWINHHPKMGLDPSLDEFGARKVAAVTGACLMLRRSVFDEIQGWDTGYLIGDFEDSDLCLAVRSRGLAIVYEPAARLTHLERQSFSAIAGDGFRHRMTICNAVRSYTRWGAMIESPLQDDARPSPPQPRAQDEMCALDAAS